MTEPEDANSGEFTAFVNAVGACALSLPGVTNRHGLPVGMQVVMAAGRDADLLRIGALLEMALGVSGT
ncbi:MAG: amidase family protein [Acidimicrobiia bacterium]|nr:amidase family protein [Acidimicrobiia bacterium]